MVGVLNMKYTYFFKDKTEVLINNGLTRNEYPLFIKDLTTINAKYGYEIYMAGGYVSYITRMSNTYNDLDFFIMAEKIIDLNDLTIFFKEFHELAKKYGFVYDLMYFMDANSEDLNMNPSTYNILNVEQTRTIKLYSKKILEGADSNTLNKLIGKPIPDSELFEGKFLAELSYKKYVDKMQKNGIFQKPLKIS